jgi:hypothetical protein
VIICLFCYTKISKISELLKLIYKKKKDNFMSDINGYEDEYVPYQNGYTIEEMIDLVQNELTISCALPKSLPDANIRQIIETRALPWFYRSYQYAVQKLYYFIDRRAFFTEEYTRYNYVTLPCEIQTVIYLYEVRGDSLFQLGINTPNLSVNLGVTNQPYLSSYVTTIGELGVYKTVLDSMSDMLNQLNKYTLKYQFNQLNHRLNILTNVQHNVIVEAYANIPQENLFKEDLFLKYVTGYAKQQLGNMMGRYDFTLPGSVKINAADLISQGKEEVKEVEEEVKGQSTSSWFIMVKK